MRKSAYILSESAEKDLRSITRYTLNKHGQKQTIKYRDKLEACAENLSNGTQFHKILSDRKPEIRYLRCPHHYIFGLEENKQMIIIAILHERMDLINRLRERLNKIDQMI